MRKTAQQLAEESKPGPETALGGGKDTYFMVTSNAGGDDDHGQVVVAELKSPLLKSSEHPKECFGFWWYFDVSLLLCA